MATTLTTRLLRPLALLGRPKPLFDKELRVASRRRRGYALRCAYVLFLMVYIAAVWIPNVGIRGAGAGSLALMEAAAKTITVNIVWFQFFAAQLVAVVMLSTAISDEVYSRTLSVLLTTPLSDRQVIVNKLCGRLFQVLLLVTTSLPLLAVVRVLGGIPWGFLLVGVLLTLAAVVFAASVSLLFSVICRRSYFVVVAGVLTLAVVFVIVPYAAMGVCRDASLQHALAGVTACLDPLVLLDRYTVHALIPRQQQSIGVWPVVSCCAFLLAASGALVACSVRLVRSVALHRAMGEPVLLEKLRRRHVEDVPAKAASTQSRRQDIRRVVGPPMIWKEMTCTLSRRERLATTIVLGIEGALILAAYSFPAMMAFVPYEMAHMIYIWGFLGLAVLFTITSSATVMSVERESRSWPVLLMTPLTDREIVVGKFVGVLRRCGPIWLSLLAYMVAFTWANCFHPAAIAHTVVISVTFLVFLSATGFYFGTRFHRTGEAVTANLVLAGALWSLPPILGILIGGVLRSHWDGGMSVAYTMVPFAEAQAMMMTTMDGWRQNIHWFGDRLDAWGVAVLTLVSMAAYGLVSLGFLWRAVRGLRRRVMD